MIQFYLSAQFSIKDFLESNQFSLPKLRKKTKKHNDLDPS